MTEREKLALCSGCRDDFYNGHNDLSVRRCWHLKSAKPVLKIRVGINDVPPWNGKPRLILDCRTEQGAVLLPPNEVARNNTACLRAKRDRERRETDAGTS